MALFEDVINRWVEEVEDDVKSILQTIVFRIGREVVTLSPVDTGRFKGNWQLTIGSPATSSLLRYDESVGIVLGDMQRVVRTLSPGQVAYIQNTVEYGYDLEYGSSPQARDPDGMVRVTAAKFAILVNEAVRLHAN